MTYEVIYKEAVPENKKLLEQLLPKMAPELLMDKAVTFEGDEAVFSFQYKADGDRWIAGHSGNSITGWHFGSYAYELPTLYKELGSAAKLEWHRSLDGAKLSDNDKTATLTLNLADETLTQTLQKMLGEYTGQSIQENMERRQATVNKASKFREIGSLVGMPLTPDSSLEDKTAALKKLAEILGVPAVISVKGAARPDRAVG